MKSSLLPNNISGHQSSLAKKTGWSAVGGLCGLLGRGVAQIVIARLLGPDGVGRIAYMIWVIEIANVFTNLGLPGSMSRYVAELHGAGKQKEASTLAQWIYLSYLALAIVGTVAAGVFFFKSSQYEWSSAILPLFVAVFLVRGLALINSKYLAGIQRFDILARINVIANACLLTCVAAGAYFFGISGVLVGYILGALFPAIYSFSILRGFSLKNKIDALLCRRVRKYSFHIWLALIATALVWSRLEVFFLERYWNAHEVAMFAVGLTFVMMIRQAAHLCTGAFLPHFSGLVGSGNREIIQRHYTMGTQLMAFIVFPLSFGGASIMPVLVPLLYGKDFISAVPNAMVLMPTSALAISLVGSSIVLAMERTGFIVLSGFAGAIFSIIAGFLIIPRFGAWGAVWSKFFVQYCMFTLGLWYIIRCLHFTFPFKIVLRTILAALLCSVVSLALIVYINASVSLAIAILAGASSYVLAIKYLRVLSSENTQQLMRLFSKLPRPMSAPIFSLVSWMTSKTS